MTKKKLIALIIPIITNRAPCLLNFIDHVVGNQPDLEMESAAEWYVNKIIISFNYIKFNLKLIIIQRAALIDSLTNQ